jgi:RimJ/RimL family protein N-acetyltransferase
MLRLIEVARREGIARIYADILEANMRMQRLCARLGFTLGKAGGGVVRADREI